MSHIVEITFIILNLKSLSFYTYIFLHTSITHFFFFFTYEYNFQFSSLRCLCCPPPKDVYRCQYNIFTFKNFFLAFIFLSTPLFFPLEYLHHVIFFFFFSLYEKKHKRKLIFTLLKNIPFIISRLSNSTFSFLR